MTANHSIPYLDNLRPELSELKPYVPDLTHFPVRLDANEAPGPWSDRVRSRLARAVEQSTLERYPDPTMRHLREALARRCGAFADEILVGVGSDELIATLLTAFASTSDPTRPPTVVTMTPTFVMYKLSARARGYRVIEIPLDDNWDLAEQNVVYALSTMQPQLLFIASPNNPTGNLVSRDRLERILDAAGSCACVIDEAYIDYAAHSQLELRKRFANLIFLRTLSKIGFAALRVGWLIGPRALVHELDKIRLPYNMTSLSQTLGHEAVTSLAADISALVDATVSERDHVTDAIARIPGYSVSPSNANFLWVRTERPAQIVYDGLRSRGILVRSFHERGGRLAHQLRITIGSHHENELLLEALAQLA